MEQGFRSRTIAMVIVSFSIVLSMTIIIATQEASSRLAWSLARDKGLLFSQHLQDIHPRFDVPMWGLLLVWLLTFTCGFLYLASKTGKKPLKSKGIVKSVLTTLRQISFQCNYRLFRYSSAAIIRRTYSSSNCSKAINNLLVSCTQLPYA
jgi:amino acid transporter